MWDSSWLNVSIRWRLESDKKSLSFDARIFPGKWNAFVFLATLVAEAALVKVKEILSRLKVPSIL